MGVMDISRAIEIRSGRQREQGQAVARPARVRFSIVSNGTGQARLVGNEALSFNAWILEEPSFTFGVIANNPIDENALPQATATVLGWRMLDPTPTSARGSVWLGAELGFRVESSQPDISVRFSLTFEGYVMRSFLDVDS
jgi:hypothetical protein